MLKGVNKQILEISNPESPYFEKIIFFVRPSANGASSEKIECEARKISSAAGTKPPRQKVPLSRVFTIAGFSLLSACAGVALSFILGTIF